MTSSTLPRGLVTGAAGQLGSALARRLSDRWTIVPFARQDLDLTDTRAVRQAVARERPTVIFNCAAYTNVDRAEEEPAAALAVNGFAVGALARAAREQDAALVHYSTDFVFKGDAARLHSEDDSPEPQNIYAQSKLIGEWLAADASRHYVLRVESLFGGERAASSIDRIIDNIKAGRETKAFSDRTVSPSFVEDVAAATTFLLDSGGEAGLYHCVNTGSTTWFELALRIRVLLGRPDAPITPIRVADLALRAARPQYAALDNAKLARAGFRMPTWEEALERYLARASA